MRLNRLLRTFVVIAAASVAACDYVETAHFLSEPSKDGNDSRLLGTWIASQSTMTKDDGVLAERVERAMIVTVDQPADDDDSNLLDISLMGISRSAGKQPEFFWLLTHGHTTRIGDRTFLNLAPTASYEVDPGAPLMAAVGTRDDEYAPQIIEYRIDAQQHLYVYLMNADYAAEAVAAGKVAGTVEKKEYSTYVKLEAEPEALARFITGAPADKLFLDPGGYFVRGSAPSDSP